MSAIADFSRMPTQKKVTIVAFVGLMIGLLYYQFVYKGLAADLEEAQNEHASKVAKNQQLERDIPEFEKLRERMATLHKLIDENQKALPTEAELPAFFETLDRKVLESGVDVVRSRPIKEERVETFIKVPVEYEIQGTFLQIKKFFASLVPKKRDPNAPPSEVPEERERIVSIENLSLGSPVVRNREIRLTAKFVASTYRLEESSGGAKPLPIPAKKPPSAATPKGAKAQTEDSLDKGDTRNRDATGVDEAKTPAAGSARMKGGL